MELCAAGSWSEGPLLVSTLVRYSFKEPPLPSALVALTQYLLLPGLSESADLCVVSCTIINITSEQG